jgi:hypothetical protein
VPKEIIQRYGNANTLFSAASVEEGFEIAPRNVVDYPRLHQESRVNDQAESLCASGG